jgi:hypothetical protein
VRQDDRPCSFAWPYLTVTNTFAALRLLPMGDRDKDVEMRPLSLTSLPREILRRLRLLVRPDTVLRRQRDLLKRRHARTCRPKLPGHPPTGHAALDRAAASVAYQVARGLGLTVDL